jgi:hypothetical protein
MREKSTLKKMGIWGGVGGLDSFSEFLCNFLFRHSFDTRVGALDSPSQEESKSTLRTHTRTIHMTGVWVGEGVHTGRLVWNTGSHPLGARMLYRPPIGMGQDAMDLPDDRDAKAMVIHVVHWLGGCGRGLGVWGCTGARGRLLSPVSEVGLGCTASQIVRWNGNNVMKLPTKF